MAQAAKVPPCTSEQWPLKRYGRFVPAGTDRFGAAAEAPPGSDPSASWKVFDSNDKSGPLVLTIVISGHFFISQGQTLLEGFSLIDSKKWLKIVRRVDCLLFGSTIKDKSRMFRVQFGGNSKEEALENCYRCVQKLEEYVTIQVPDELSQELQPGPSQIAAETSQVKDSEQSGLHLNLKPHYASSRAFPEGRVSMIQLAQLSMEKEAGNVREFSLDATDLLSQQRPT
ncbi:meiotic recombination protein REC114 isoform X2 [Petaurus breviceps papuanus]|uniref:meiotic recombination protein REC114 isoform X2 n=1 Tax=Petaurus breviceps papuanus TaxID=3040969 RepID=UPI0036D98B26